MNKTRSNGLFRFRFRFFQHHFFLFTTSVDVSSRSEQSYGSFFLSSIYRAARNPELLLTL
jgi:hypothetical protein